MNKARDLSGSPQNYPPPAVTFVMLSIMNQPDEVTASLAQANFSADATTWTVVWVSKEQIAYAKVQKDLEGWDTNSNDLKQDSVTAWVRPLRTVTKLSVEGFDLKRDFAGYPSASSKVLVHFEDGETIPLPHTSGEYDPDKLVATVAAIRAGLG